VKFDFRNTKIYIKPGTSDFRASRDRVVSTVSNLMKKDPLSGALFVFCNGTRKKLKFIWWDRNGFWIAQKQLEKGMWPWPETQEDVKEMSVKDMNLLLEGIDCFHKHEEMKIKK